MPRNVSSGAVPLAKVEDLDTFRIILKEPIDIQKLLRRVGPKIGPDGKRSESRERKIEEYRKTILFRPGKRYPKAGN